MAIMPVFIDPKLQKKFDEDGYVKFRLLTDEQADDLYRFYFDHQKEHAKATELYHSTSDTNDAELIAKVDAKLTDVLLPEIKKHLANFDVMICNYLVKDPGPGSDTILHQDPTFVDESQYFSGNVWVGLRDIGHENGNLFFLKGSNTWIKTLRVSPTCPSAYDEVRSMMPDYVTEVPVKKGEAILINHAVVHGATANLAKTPRVAAVMAIKSKGAQWMFHYLERGGAWDKIEQYAVTKHSFTNMEKGQRPPDSKLLGYVTHDFPMLSKEEFLKRAKKNEGIFAKLKSLLTAS